MSEISLKFFLGTWDCGDLNAADSREPRLVIIGLVAVYKYQSDKLSLLFLSQKDDEPVSVFLKNSFYDGWFHDWLLNFT